MIVGVCVRAGPVAPARVPPSEGGWRRGPRACVCACVRNLREGILCMFEEWEGVKLRFASLTRLGCATGSYNGDLVRFLSDPRPLTEPMAYAIRRLPKQRISPRAFGVQGPPRLRCLERRRESWHHRKRRFPPRRRSLPRFVRIGAAAAQQRLVLRHLGGRGRQRLG